MTLAAPSYSFSSDAAGSADITIKAADGTEVYRSSNVSINSGEQTFTWSGTDNSGNRLPKGTYTINFEQDADSDLPLKRIQWAS